MSSSRKSPAAILRRLKQSAPDGKGELPELEKRQEFTIDQLAREAGSTVRNVRAYQDRGLLPPPEKRGRTGIYTDVHLARLKIIGALLIGHQQQNIGASQNLSFDPDPNLVA
mgnify:CR=1 FL=1